MDNQSSYFEDITMPPVLLAGLYKNMLVVTESKAVPKKNESTTTNPAILNDSFMPADIQQPHIADAAATTANLNSLGDFLQSVLILVNDVNSLHLAEPELELLGKMLQAVKLSFADVAIVNIANQLTSWEMLHQQLPARRVILFGVEPTAIQIPVRFPHFRVQNWANANFLYSPSLAELNKPSPSQVQLKKDLWKALLEMFNNN